MPIIPTVFRPIRANDVQFRPLKTYKRYIVTSGSFSGSGYRTHTGLHNRYAVHVGDDTYNYLTNYDGTNYHVVWRSTDHRYYRHPYDPAQCHEHTNRRKTEKFLFYSSSALTVPYFEVGEHIKPGSFTVQSSVNNNTIQLEDDGNGNLRDLQILTSSFATASRCFFKMDFNNEFRQFESNFGYIKTGSVEYQLRGQTYKAIAYNTQIGPGVTMTGSGGTGTSGLAAFTDIGGGSSARSSIQIPYNELFNRCNKCDRWTISLWCNILTGCYPATLINKSPLYDEQYFDVTQQKILTRKTNNVWPWLVQASSTDLMSTLVDTFNNNQRRTPFSIGIAFATSAPSFLPAVYFACSNGTNSLILTSSFAVTNPGWTHIAVVNNNDAAVLYINGVAANSGSMPNESTANNAYIEIGASEGDNTTNAISPYPGIDEIRMYDYALPVSEIASLANRDYLSGSLYQTNIVGNVFYRNGQAVVSSVIPKYNSGSGFFNTAFTASYRGTHTVYENEVLVRVPADQFNYTLNPTATYRPGTDDSNNTCNATPAGAESNNGPGELYLSSFVSGTVGPYVTAIGLYNDKQQLLAVGKLGTAITKRPDIDTHFILRWDY